MAENIRRSIAALILPAVLLVSGCAAFGFSNSEETEENRLIATETLDALVASGVLDDGVTIGRVDYANHLDRYRTLTVNVSVPDDVDLLMVEEEIGRALWLSEVSPYETLDLYGRPRTPAEEVRATFSFLGRVPGAYPRGWTSQKPGEGVDPDGYESYEILTQRWGPRPVPE